MFEHLQYKQAVIILKSPAGRQADRVLDLNDDASVRYREFVLDLVRAVERDRRELIELIGEMERQMRQFPERAEELKSEKDSANDELEKTEKNLIRLCGAA